MSLTSLYLKDHLGGFSNELDNLILSSLPNRQIRVTTEYVISKEIKQKYPHINFSFDLNTKKHILGGLTNYNIHPKLNYKNFVCSFNGSPHVGRKLLVSILNRFGYFNPKFCSKNFSYSADTLDGHLTDYVNNNSFYRTFFISPHSEEFFQTVNSFGHIRYDHANNIYNLEHKLTESFLHIVSETMATSYYPFVTEKFLYSVVTRGLFLTYAQPGWHAHLEKYYGFKLYTKLFDYRFDNIQNPVERVVELITMLSKFSILSTDDWRDLYMLQQDEIEFNYDHYFSGNYLKTLQQHCNE